MPRLFVALRPPPPIRDRLVDRMLGIPDARWQDDDQLHLTLRFIGDVDARVGDDIAAALATIRAERIAVQLAGVGAFGPGGSATTLWAGVEPRRPLAALHAKIDRALVLAGLDPESRAYRPHITVARLARSAGRAPEVARWLADNASLASEAFVLDRVILYESTLRRDGASYDAVAAWPLS